MRNGFRVTDVEKIRIKQGQVFGGVTGWTVDIPPALQTREDRMEALTGRSLRYWFQDWRKAMDFVFSRFRGKPPGPVLR
jgi:hypothetical protein